jgi:hypothetical protein
MMGGECGRANGSDSLYSTSFCGFVPQRENVRIFVLTSVFVRIATSGLRGARRTGPRIHKTILIIDIAPTLQLQMTRALCVEAVYNRRRISAYVKVQIVPLPDTLCLETVQSTEEASTEWHPQTVTISKHRLLTFHGARHKHDLHHAFIKTLDPHF